MNTNNFHYTIYILILISYNAHCQVKKVATDLLQEYNVTGSITLFDYNAKKWIYSDFDESNKKTLPASTFKIVNTLILLEEGIIENSDQIIPWPGNIDTVKYGNRTEIFRDLTVEEAFQNSAVWAYLELSKQIPNSKYISYLKKIGYGNNYILDHNIDFWNFGEFGVTPIEQIEMLIKLYDNDLPFKKKHQKSVKKIMLTESKVDSKAYGKTGWTSYDNIRIGWWIGYVELTHGPVFFATRLYKPKSIETDNFGNARIEITTKYLSRFY